ncbi:unnamed protein product [Sphagnum balticum]
MLKIIVSTGTGFKEAKNRSSYQSRNQAFAIRTHREPFVDDQGMFAFRIERLVDIDLDTGAEHRLEIQRAIEAIYRHNVVHNDIDPSNIMLNQHGSDHSHRLRRLPSPEITIPSNHHITIPRNYTEHFYMADNTVPNTFYMADDTTPVNQNLILETFNMADQKLVLGRRQSIPDNPEINEPEDNPEITQPEGDEAEDMEQFVKSLMDMVTNFLGTHSQERREECEGLVKVIQAQVEAGSKLLQAQVEAGSKLFQAQVEAGPKLLQAQGEAIGQNAETAGKIWLAQSETAGKIWLSQSETRMRQRCYELIALVSLSFLVLVALFLLVHPLLRLSKFFSRPRLIFDPDADQAP